MIVIVAAVLGHDLILPTKFPLSKPEDALHGFANWDGEWYLRIAQSGYDYDPSQPSSVAFFPAYPLLARGVSRVLGVDPVVSLLVVSHASLIAAFALTVAYVRLRFPDCILFSRGVFGISVRFFHRSLLVRDGAALAASPHRGVGRSDHSRAAGRNRPHSAIRPPRLATITI
jgi:hypothetical protein